MYQRLRRSPISAFPVSTAVRMVCEALETRRLFHNVVVTELPDQTFQMGAAGIDLNLANYIDNTDLTGTIVEMNTNGGPIDIELYDSATPVTVANFLNYVNSSRYNGTIFHRGESGFIQGGTFTTNGAVVRQITLGGVTYNLPDFTNGVIQQDAEIPFEYASSPRDANGHVNVAGTIAMARKADPDSATSGFFINTTDNLGFDAGAGDGYTVFGHVISGMNIASQIDNFDHVWAPQADFPYNLSSIYGFYDLPTINGYTRDPGGLPASNQIAYLTNVSVIGENTFTISSSNTSVINPSVTGSILSLNPANGGTATITVTATSLDGDVVSDSFDVTVIATETTVTVGAGASKSLVFTDADGTKTTIESKNATASIHITGSDVSTSTSNKGVTTVTGTGLVIDDIDLTAMGAASKLTVSAKGGDGVVSLPDITADGTLATLDASKAVLTGALSTAGSLGTVKLDSIVGGSISTVGADTELSLTVGSVSDAGINVAGSIKKLATATWADTDATPDTVSATTLDSLTVKGDFAPDITITGSGIGSASVSGTLTGGTWNVTGGLNKLTARTVAAGWTGIFGAAVGTVGIGDVFDGVLAVTSVKKVQAKTFSASLTASATDGDAIGTLTATTMSAAEVRSAGNVKSITVSKGINASGIYLGVADGVTSIDDASDFTNANARLAKATFKPAAGTTAFGNSAIIAPIFGKVSLGTAADVAPTVPFYGVATGLIEDLAFTLDGQKARIKNAEDQAAADAQLTDQEIGRTNFEVIVV